MKMEVKSAISWFKIPSKDFSRATKFYETIFSINLQPMQGIGDIKIAAFPFDMNGGVGGSIVHEKGSEPSDKGTLVYLNGGDDLSVILSRVEKAGGKIETPKTSLGPNGFFAHFFDTEGNKVALHSKN